MGWVYDRNMYMVCASIPIKCFHLSISSWNFFLTYAQLGTSFFSSFKILHKRFIRYKCPWYSLFVASFSLFLFRLVIGVLVVAEFQLGFLLLHKCCLWYLLILLLLTTPLEHLHKLLLKFPSYTYLILFLDQQV